MNSFLFTVYDIQPNELSHLFFILYMSGFASKLDTRTLLNFRLTCKSATYVVINDIFLFYLTLNPDYTARYLRLPPLKYKLPPYIPLKYYNPFTYNHNLLCYQLECLENSILFLRYVTIPFYYTRPDPHFDNIILNYNKLVLTSQKLETKIILNYISFLLY